MILIANDNLERLKRERNLIRDKQDKLRRHIEQIELEIIELKFQEKWLNFQETSLTNSISKIQKGEKKGE